MDRKLAFSSVGPLLKGNSNISMSSRCIHGERPQKAVIQNTHSKKYSTADGFNSTSAHASEGMKVPRSFSVSSRSNNTNFDTNEGEDKSNSTVCSIKTEPEQPVAEGKSRLSAFGPPRRPRRSALSVVSAASSSDRTQAEKTVALPYLPQYTVEDNEGLFTDLQKTLRAPNCRIFPLARAVQTSKDIFCSSWLKDGNVNGVLLGNIEPSHLVICLDKTKFPVATLPLLKTMAKKMKLCTLVQDLVVESGVTANYPKISDLQSGIITPREDVLQSILFLSRVYCAKKYLGRPLTNESGSWGINLDGKMKKCLGILEDSIQVKIQEPGGDSAVPQSLEAPAPPIVQQKDTACRISVTEEDQKGTVVSPKEDTSSSSIERKRSHEEVAHIQQLKEELGCIVLNKKRRMSLDEQNTFNYFGTKALLDSNLSAAEKLDFLEVYFKQGVAAIHELRLQLHQEIALQKVGLKKSNSREPSPVPMLKESPSPLPKVKESNSPPPPKRASSPLPGDATMQDVIEKSAGDSRRVSVSSNAIQRQNPEEEVEWNDTGAVSGAVAATESPEDKDTKVTKKIMEVLKTKWWRKCKFLKCDASLDRICKDIAKEAGVDEKEFTEKYRISVGKALVAIRSGVKDKMKKAVLDYMDSHEGHVPEVDALVSIRECVRSNEAQSLTRFEFLWDYLLPCVSDTWAKEKNQRFYVMSEKRSLKGKEVDVLTKSDEAFALLAFENYRDIFISDWKKTRKGIEVKAKAMYSGSGRKKRGTEFLAWGSQECEDRWIEMQKLVKADRENDIDNEAEKRMLRRLQKRKEEQDT